jgi:hypothetical protein
LYGEEVIVSTSPVPKIPLPVLKSQYLVLTLLSAGPVKLSAQICFHAGVTTFADPLEQLVLARTAITPSPAASHRYRFEERVRSLAPQHRISSAYLPKEPSMSLIYPICSPEY